MKERQYTVLVLDDQLDSMYHVINTLKNLPYIAAVQEESDIRKARDRVDQGDIDILFLDLIMPEADGFTFLGFLQHVPATIVCSSTGESAYEAFDHGVIDYISKLSSKKRVELALAKAIAHLNRREENRKDAEAAIQLRRCSDDEEVLIDWRKITYVSINDYILTIAFDDAEEQEYYCSLSGFLDKVPADNFLRIHRSFVVKTDAIRSRTHKELTLINWHKLPIGSSYSAELDAAIERMKSRR